MNRKMVYATVGLPASGKSTKAREMQAEDPTLVLVSKDELRAMLHSGRYSKANERQVVEMRDAIIQSALYENRSVVVHDTNFGGGHLDALQLIANEYSAGFQLLDFTKVPYQTCLERNRERTGAARVPDKVIIDMYRKYLYKAPIAPSAPPGAPEAIIVDMDGTLALLGDRSPYDATGLCANDSLNEPVYQLVQAMYRSRLIIMSGREDTPANRTATTQWLQRHGVHFDELLMRPAGDTRKDSIIKRELFDQFVLPHYNVKFVVDDRPQVVRMWRELGLFVFDVNQMGLEF